MELQNKAAETPTPQNNNQSSNNEEEETDRPKNETNKPPLKKVIINIIHHLTLVGITIYIIYTSFENGITFFSWHPTLMMIGFVIMMAEAILAFTHTNRLLYKQQVVLHWICHSIGFSLIIAGFAVVIINKNRNNYSHFNSAHSIAGLITIICVILSIIGGVVTKFSFQLRKLLRPIRIKLFHSIFGALTFMLAMITILLALFTPYFISITATEVRYYFILKIAIVCIFVLFRAVKTVISRLKA